MNPECTFSSYWYLRLTAHISQILVNDLRDDSNLLCIGHKTASCVICTLLTVNDTFNIFLIVYEEEKMKEITQHVKEFHESKHINIILANLENDFLPNCTFSAIYVEDKGNEIPEGLKRRLEPGGVMVAHTGRKTYQINHLGRDGFSKKHISLQYHYQLSLLPKWLETELTNYTKVKQMDHTELETDSIYEHQLGFNSSIPLPPNSKTLLEILECPVCFGTLTAPVSQCIHGHCACSKCRISLYRCPVCQGQLIDSPCNLINYILQLEFSCKASKYGCTKRCNLNELRFHEINCTFNRETICLIQKCGKTVINALFDEHIQKEHGELILKQKFPTKFENQIDLTKWNDFEEVKFLKEKATDSLFEYCIKIEDSYLYCVLLYVGTNIRHSLYKSCFVLYCQGEEDRLVKNSQVHLFQPDIDIQKYFTFKVSKKFCSDNFKGPVLYVECFVDSK